MEPQNEPVKSGSQSQQPETPILEQASRLSEQAQAVQTIGSQQGTMLNPEPSREENATLPTKKKKTGLIIALCITVPMIILTILFIIGAIILTEVISNPVAGEYDCSRFDGVSSSGDYSITMKLNKDGTFVYGQYGDLNRNHASGTYSYEQEYKVNAIDGYDYYTIKMDGSNGEYLVNGKPSGTNFESELEFGVTKQGLKKEGLIVFPHNYSMFYCSER